MNSRRNIFIVVAVIVVIAIIAIVSKTSPTKSNVPLTSFHDKNFGFDIKYPNTWEIQDSMNKNGCCLFIVEVNTATTTATSTDGVAHVTVTKTEPIRMQIGYYYKATGADPFTMASTTRLSLGANTAYSGTANNIPFYLIPMTPLDGIGTAVFTALDNTDTKGTQKAVEDILSTIVFTGTSTESLQTYKNDNYGYELDVPASWHVNSTYSDSPLKAGGISGKIITGGEVLFENQDSSKLEVGQPANYLSVDTLVYKMDLPLDELLKTEMADHGENATDIKTTYNFTADSGITGKEFDIVRSDSGLDNKMSVILLRSGNMTFSFTADSNSKVIAEEIAKSFRLIK